MSSKWFVIGISGVTCGGKTTIANQLNKIIPASRVINQDDYFLPVDDERHIWIPELNHINFDILSSLDMNKMYEDVQEIISDSSYTPSLSNRKLQEFSLSSADLQAEVVRKLKDMNLNVLILEGFCIFCDKAVERLCNLKYFTTLSKQECCDRRIQRVYEPPDCPGYFEHCVWPEYVRQFEDIKTNVEDVHYISEFTEDPIRVILNNLMQSLDLTKPL